MSELSGLPAVERVRAALGSEHPHQVVVGAARRAVDVARAQLRSGESVEISFEEVVEIGRSLLAAHSRSLLGPVINATGVLLHTNLGRAPLGPRQLHAVARVAGAYSNLEYDVTAGRRGSRYAHAAKLLAALTGAEAAVVVNNNAAAVLVTLAALCSGREVIISRGELIEIGGEFRIPDIMATSGARLVEVGTTNRTHLGDYEKAITTETAAILKVHPSNYRVVGFTATVDARDVARLARGRKLCFIHDIGSGLVSSEPGWAAEPTVADAIDDGADIVTFSGDKLFGGPQAGMILGRAELVERIVKHPLMRALRVDKMTLAALEETLRIYLEDSLADLPLWHRVRVPSEQLEERARRLAGLITDGGSDDLKVEARPHRAVTGGGSLPGADLGSWAVTLTHATKSADELERDLRFGSPAIIAVVEDERVVLDLRTVTPEDDAVLITRVLALA